VGRQADKQTEQTGRQAGGAEEQTGQTDGAGEAGRRNRQGLTG